MATGFGAIPVRRLGGGPIRIRPYNVLASDSTALYVGDFVQLAGTLDAVSQLPDLAPHTAGQLVVGVVVGFLPDPTQPYNGHYRPASTARTVLVCDDPEAVFQIQEDAVGGAVSAANVASGANADVIVAAGSAVTGLSGHMLDSNTAGASAASLKIVGVKRDKVNAAAQSGGAILEVIIHEHALKTADSIT